MATPLKPDLTSLERTLDAARDRLVEALGDDAHGLVADIRGLLAAQAALETERRRVADRFVDAPEAYVVTDELGTIREANRAAVSLLASAPDELPGHPLARFVETADRRRFRRAVARAAADGRIDGVTVRIAGRGGGVWCDLRATAGETDDGPELRWSLRDVTARVKAERTLAGLNAELERRVAERTAALDTERAQLETVLQQLPVGIVIVDAETQRVQTANAAAAVLGVAANGSRPFSDLRTPLGEPVSPEDAPTAVAIRTGSPTPPTRYVVDGPAGDMTVELAASAVTATDGSVAAVVLRVEDVTDRDRRERADREFISNAAHQLRTPLTAIASSVAVLQGGAKDDPAARDKFLGHLQRETDRLSRLGRALLTLARAQRGDEDAPLAVVPLAPLLDDAVAEQTAKDGVDVTVTCSHDVAAVTNAELLEEAVANLIGNALAYTDHGSVDVLARADADEIVVEVSDTGRGIPPEESAVVFDRFYRAARSAGSAGGFGLGLPIAKAAVDAAGGRLELESGRERGTVARIRLRAAKVLA